MLKKSQFNSPYLQTLTIQSLTCFQPWWRHYLSQNSLLISAPFSFQFLSHSLFFYPEKIQTVLSHVAGKRWEVRNTNTNYFIFIIYVITSLQWQVIWSTSLLVYLGCLGNIDNCLSITCWRELITDVGITLALGV